MFRGRRDSNTSTLSSYFSSLRSDNSPNPFGSLASSRRSSEVSTNRLSITNSPYEYDITGNRPMNHSRRSCNSDTSANVSTMEAQFQKTNLGSQSNLQTQGSSLRCSSASAASKYQQERIARFLAARQDCNSARTSTPCRTPLPHEMPNRDARRASDPVRAMDTNYSALKQLQRFHSLNMVKPLPVPQRGLRNKSNSNNTFHSSRSSIATDHGVEEFDSQFMDTDTEAALEEKMLEDNEDMIIPDDMRRFLNERYGDGHSLFSYDPSALTESQINYLQQGAHLNSANFVQTSQEGSNLGNQYSSCNSAQNFYNNINHNNNNSNSLNNSSNQPMNYNNQSINSNMRINSQGPINTSVSNSIQNDSPSAQQLSRENTAAWIQGQNSLQQNLPLPPSMGPPGQNVCPPVHPQQGMMSPQHGNCSNIQPQIKTKDSGMNSCNMNWNVMIKSNGSMPNLTPNGSQGNVQHMMSSPVPHPPLTPKSSQNLPHMPKMNQMPMNQNQMMQQHALMQGQGHIPHLQGQGHIPHPPPVAKVERSSPQVQVPHISQSQIPPRAKAANRNQSLPSQQPQSLQQPSLNQQQALAANQNTPVMNNMQVPYANKMCPGYGPMNFQQQQMYQQQFMNMQFNGPMNNNPGFNPNCQQVQDQRTPYSKLEMSPGCNQVSSSTDITEPRREPEAPPIENFMDNLNSISSEAFMDNINSISQENMNQVYSPTAMSNRSNSQASRYNNALMNTSNMVINDMSSVMVQLAEENKYFTRRH